MEYLGKDIPKLGFGLMRLPMLGEEVDLEQTKQMVDKFLEAGFTYFDTAYGYLEGKSEEAVKTALVDRYPRESFQLATKLPAWAGAQTAGEAKEMLQTSLRRTGAGYFDFYLLHNCGDDRTQAFDKFGIWDYALEMKEKGLLKHVGFSFHDKADVLDELLTKHPEMEFVQLQINYADWEDDNVQSRRCYEVARKHNKPVIIMEPVKGGLLANPPETVAQVLKAAAPEKKPALLGAALCRLPGRDHHCALRHVHLGADGAEPSHHEGVQPPLRPGAGRGGPGPGGTCQPAQHSLHQLPVLREGLPPGHPHPGGVQRHEHPPYLREHRAGQGQLRLRHPGQGQGQRLHPVRPVRKRMSPAHFHHPAAAAGCRGVGVSGGSLHKTHKKKPSFRWAFSVDTYIPNGTLSSKK